MDLPFVGINSPGHFLIGYQAAGNADAGAPNSFDRIEFIVDPFNGGTVFEAEDFILSLRQQEVAAMELDRLIASNTVIVRRVLNNMTYARAQTGDRSSAEELLFIAETIPLNEALP